MTYPDKPPPYQPPSDRLERRSPPQLRFVSLLQAGDATYACQCYSQATQGLTYRACTQKRVDHAGVAVRGCHMKSCKAITWVIWCLQCPFPVGIAELG